MKLWLGLGFALAVWGEEIVVYGGTSAGVAAAVEAHRSGRSVVLVSPEKHPGGMSVEGLGSSDINNHWFRNDVAVGGIAKEFYLRIGKKYGAIGPVYLFEAHVAEGVFQEMLAGVRVVHGILQTVEWRAGTKRIAAIRLGDGTRVEGSAFIDASTEGDLIAAAGVETVIGREANAKYGETKNGIRDVNEYRQFPFKMDPYVVEGKPESGLLPTVQNEPLGRAGDGDHRIQGYCFRLCLTKDPSNRIVIEKPADYDGRRYEIYRRYARMGGDLFTPQARLPHGKTDLGSWHDLSANLYGMNFEYPGGDAKTRQRVYDEHRAFVHGLLWFLSHDEGLPEKVRAAWREWGLARDEFVDNGGWPRALYVRDARRMVSDYVITEQHTWRVNPVVAEDPVAVAYWPPDTHHVRRIVRDGAVYNEGFVFGGEDWGPFGISYRSMVPRAKEVLNLITPTCLSSSHVAYGAVRIEFTFMALGQAAAVAADVMLREKTTMQRVDYGKLRAELVKRGAVVALNLPVGK
jgi:hypothetical protein